MEGSVLRFIRDLFGHRVTECAVCGRAIDPREIEDGGGLATATEGSIPSLRWMDRIPGSPQFPVTGKVDIRADRIGLLHS